MTTPGVNGGWSVKDLVAHITRSEREMMEVIRQRALVGSPLWALGHDERNAIVYAENRDRELDDVLSDEQRVYAALLPLLESLTSEDLVDSDRWQQMLPNVPPWRIFAGSTFLHYEDHADALRRWLRAEGTGGATG
jgi:Mycothiol maleylpyruvate isomerase N-terminal domain